MLLSFTCLALLAVQTIIAVPLSLNTHGNSLARRGTDVMVYFRSGSGLEHGEKSCNSQQGSGVAVSIGSGLGGSDKWSVREKQSCMGFVFDPDPRHSSQRAPSQDQLEGRQGPTLLGQRRRQPIRVSDEMQRGVKFGLA